MAWNGDSARGLGIPASVGRYGLGLEPGSESPTVEPRRPRHAGPSDRPARTPRTIQSEKDHRDLGRPPIPPRAPVAAVHWTARRPRSPRFNHPTCVSRVDRFCGLALLRLAPRTSCMPNGVTFPCSRCAPLGAARPRILPPAHPARAQARQVEARARAWEYEAATLVRGARLEAEGQALGGRDGLEVAMNLKVKLGSPS